MRVQLPAGGWRPRPYQQLLWDRMKAGCRRAIPVWHRRAGKDDVALHWTARAAHVRRGVYWHMLPQANQARKAVWDAINPHTGQKRIDDVFPQVLRSNTRVQDMTIELKCGSLWQLVGSDNYNSLVGTPPVGIVFSEWALADPAAWAYLSPILEENGGWAMFITTPRGKNHAYRMFKMAQQSPSWFSQVLSISDTDIITQERYEEIKRERCAEFGDVFGEALCEQEYLCSFEAAVLGAYYSKEMATAERAGRICEVPHDPDLPVHTAWDIGVDDSTSIWLFQVLAGGLNVIGYYENSGLGADHYCDWLETHDYTWGHDLLPHDVRVREWGVPGARTRFETLQRLKRRPRTVPMSPLSDGINAARRTLPSCRFDAKGCERGLDALRNYHTDYDEETRVLGKLPVHDWSSHGADAYRTLAMGWRELRLIEPPPPRKVDAYIGQPDGTIQSSLSIREIVERQKQRRLERA